MTMMEAHHNWHRGKSWWDSGIFRDNNEMCLGCPVQSCWIRNDQISRGENVKRSCIGPLQFKINLVFFIPIGDFHPPHMMINHILSISHSEPGQNILMLMLIMKTDL